MSMILLLSRGENLEDGVQECDSTVVSWLSPMTFTLYKTTMILNYHFEGVIPKNKQALSINVHRWSKIGMEALSAH